MILFKIWRSGRGKSLYILRSVPEHVLPTLLLLSELSSGGFPISTIINGDQWGFHFDWVLANTSSWQSSTSSSCRATNSCSRYSLCPWPVGKACPLEQKWLVFSFSEQPDYKNIGSCLQCFDTLVHPFTEPYGQQKRALPGPGHGSAEHLEDSMSISKKQRFSVEKIYHVHIFLMLDPLIPSPFPPRCRMQLTQSSAVAFNANMATSWPSESRSLQRAPASNKTCRVLLLKLKKNLP